MDKVEHNGAKVYVYTRVSTSMQVDGYSLEAQKTAILAYAQYQHMTVVKEYSDEGFSGKNIAGRLQFQQMLNDITAGKDDVKFVLVFKLSRFGRNAADVLSSLQLMQDFGVNLICIADNIDSSADSGKLMISIMSAIAEIERENILVQTMAGRLQKAHDGGWNGGFAPYGYALIDGNLVVNEDEAKVVRLIYDKYANTTMGANGVANWLNNHGYQKKIRQNGSLDTFSAHFVKLVLDNPIYSGKIAYGRRKTTKIQGKRNEYHIVKQNTYPIYEGQHNPIVSEELWNRAHAKRIETGFRSDKLEKDHEYILSGLLKCPGCGAPMYGTVSRSKKRADGTPYPPYYSYICRNSTQVTGHACSWKRQISAPKTDASVRDIIISLVKTPKFQEIMKDMIGEQLDSSELQAELDSSRKNLRQALGTQKKLEQQMDALDVTDHHFDRKYESLNRRLEQIFDTIDKLEQQISQVQARIEKVKGNQLSRDSVYKYLMLFDQIYDKMTDKEKKTLMQSFIRSIDIYPEKQQNGQQLKTIHFLFPVSYAGNLTTAISLPCVTTDETVCLLSRNK